MTTYDSLANMEAEIIAIDPGDPHVGMASFKRTKSGQWVCHGADESTPYQGVAHLVKCLPYLSAVVVEEWQLYPDMVKTLTGSKCETARTIGMLQWVVHEYNPPGNPDLVPLVFQPAQIQNPTKGLLRSVGIKSTAKRRGAGPHALSAELHGWHFLIRNGLIEGVTA